MFFNDNLLKPCINCGKIFEVKRIGGVRERKSCSNLCMSTALYAQKTNKRTLFQRYQEQQKQLGLGEEKIIESEEMKMVPQEIQQPTAGIDLSLQYLRESEEQLKKYKS